MKTNLLFTLLLAFVAFSSFTHPQPAAAVHQATGDGYLRAHRQGNSVALSWPVTAGADHFLVERSYDFGETFEPVAEVPPAGRTNRYLDSGAYPGTIHYRVTAVDADGNELSAATDVVRIVRRG